VPENGDGKKRVSRERIGRVLDRRLRIAVRDAEDAALHARTALARVHELVGLYQRLVLDGAVRPEAATPATRTGPHAVVPIEQGHMEVPIEDLAALAAAEAATEPEGEDDE
jgi:hypothetical protein